MGRPKEFERQSALDKAMELFWTRGYEATTMTDIKRELGIGRQSLYDTFGDKDQLFAEVLQQYARFGDADVTKWLNTEGGISGIRSFLNTRVKQLSNGSNRGCLIINTCVELTDKENELARLAQCGLKNLQDGFEAAVSLGKTNGEFPTELHSKQIAVFLTAQVTGMAVMAKANVTRNQLQTVADMALKVLT